MINVSNNFYIQMQERTNFLEYATVTFLDGSVLELTPADFTISNNNIVDAAGGNEIPLGIAIEKTIQIELINTDEKYKGYYFYGATFEISLKYELDDETVETIKKGTYTVVEPETYGSTILISATDEMWKADAYVDMTINFPITVGTLLSNICNHINIALGTLTFANSDYVLTKYTQNLAESTYRQIIGYIAQFAGGNARINVDDELEIITYPFAEIDKMETSVEGDITVISDDAFPLVLAFEEDPTTFQQMSIKLFGYSGTTIKSYNTVTLKSYIVGNTITLPNDSTITNITDLPVIMEVKWLSYYDGTWHASRILLPNINRGRATSHILRAWQMGNFSIATEDVQITGIKTSVQVEVSKVIDGETHTQTEDQEFTVGTDDYMLAITNPFIYEDNVTAVLALIGTQMIGGRMRPFEGDHVSYPIAEFMDTCYVVTQKGEIIPSIITDIDYSVLGYTNIKNSAQPVLRTRINYANASAQTLMRARTLVNEERTEREKSVQQLSTAITNSPGLYTTTVTDQSGAQTFYFHNKPTLSESSTVWKFNSDAWGVSTDGGQTWNGGMMASGDTVVRILSAEGINAGWIDTGELSVKKGQNEVLYVNVDTGVVRIVADSFSLSSGDTINSIAQASANAALTAANTYADGIGATAATDATNKAANALALAQQYTDSNLNDYKEDIDAIIANMQEQIDGQIETWYYDYEPTLNNAPAVDWTTEADKELHEGDIFFWESTGNSYRFMKTNNVWGWSLIQDSQVAVAIARAAAAQATADSKRRIFITQPVPPYDVGDLWTQGATGDIMTCVSAKAQGTTYQANDWSKLNRYTDDTAVENLDIGARNLALATATPKTSAASASNSAYTGYYYFSDYGQNLFKDNTTDYITISADYETVGASPSGSSTVRIYAQTNGALGNGKFVYPASDAKGRYVSTFKLNSSQASYASSFRVRFRLQYAANGATVTISNLKIEKGNKATDWSSAPEDVEAELTNFINGSYATTIQSLQTQIDGKAQTWRQEIDPATNWTAAEKLTHEGDLWYKTTDNTTYYYTGSDWAAETIPDSVFDVIDGKAQIFAVQPTTPYYIGDLWVQGSTGDILKCKTEKTSGSYSASDWEKACKYTDDSALTTFINGDYANTVSSLQTQVDGKAETWYGSNDPSESWTTAALKAKHDGDLWYRTTDNTTWRYTSGQWSEQSAPDAVFDAIDGKAQIFVTQPTPPYYIGDLWVQGTDGDILRCQTQRTSGSYTASDWVKASKYTDDELATIANNKTTAKYGTCSTAIGTQVKVVTLSDFTLYKGARISVYFTYSNTAASPQLNVNGTGAKTIRYAGAALAASSPYTWSAKSVVDFVYTGSYWDIADSSALAKVRTLDNSLTQQEVFNRLTNNGVEQGIYLQGGKLYINGTYMQVGKISSANGRIYFDLDNNELSCSKLVAPTLINGDNAATQLQIGTDDNVSNVARLFLGVRDYENNGIAFTVYKYGSAEISTPSLYMSHSDTLYISADNGFQIRSGPSGDNLKFAWVRSDRANNRVRIERDLSVARNTQISGTLTVSSTKNRTVKTDNYNDRLLYCYEMAEPVFGDFGGGMIDDSGECVVALDDIFAETINSTGYRVFLQKEGAGDLYVSRKEKSYFIVTGTAGLAFSWEVKAKQKDFDDLRLEQTERQLIFDDDMEENAKYDFIFENELETLIKEMEDNIYETT